MAGKELKGHVRLTGGKVFGPGEEKEMQVAMRGSKTAKQDLQRLEEKEVFGKPAGNTEDTPTLPSGAPQPVEETAEGGEEAGTAPGTPTEDEGGE